MSKSDKQAHDTQVAHVVSIVASVIMFWIAILGFCSLFLEWWSGPTSSTIVGETTSISASINLWSYDITMRVPISDDSPEMKETKLSASWDDMCKLKLEQEKATPPECTKIQVARAFVCLTPIFALAVTIILIISVKMSPLLLLLAGLLEILTLGCSVVGCVMGLMIGASGLTGPGYLCLMACVFFSGLSFVATLFAAGKAMPQVDEGAMEIVNLSREQRSMAARQKAQEEFERLEGVAKGRTPRSARSGATGESESIGFDDEAEEPDPEANKKKPPVHLQRVLFWSQQAGYDEDEEIPTEMLELAFREIDKDGTGEIDADELVEALRCCGLEVSDAAITVVMKEIDKNASGDIDIHEFVEFFRHVEELNRFSKKTAARAQFLTFVCSFCFLFHLILLGVLLMVFINMKKADDPDSYVITQNLLNGVSFVLTILFVFVILLPALRLTLGPNIAAWQHHIHEARQKRLAGKKPGSSSDNSGGGKGGNRQGAWASPNIAAGDPIPVNAAMYGASYRVRKQAHMTQAPAWDAPQPYPDTVVLHAQTRGADTPQYDDHHEMSNPGCITSGGNFERYDPGAYRHAAMMASETAPSATFNAFHTKPLGGEMPGSPTSPGATGALALQN